jgi:hypothetical protein
MPTCKMCNEEVDSLSRVAERWVLDFIKEQHPEWVQEDGVCPKCVEYYDSLDNVVSVVSVVKEGVSE